MRRAACVYPLAHAPNPTTTATIIKGCCPSCPACGPCEAVKPLTMREALIDTKTRAGGPLRCAGKTTCGMLCIECHPWSRSARRTV